MDTIDLLKDIYIFADFFPVELEEISKITKKQSFAEDEHVFQQESGAEALYIIQKGMIRIHQKNSDNENLEVAVLGTGSHFGEMALVDQSPRSATATAIEESQVFIIDYRALSDVLEQNHKIAVKLYKSIAHFLCGRLRVTTNDLKFAREKNLRFF